MCFGSHFLFAKFEGEDTIYITLSDRFAFSATELCKNKCITNYTLKCREKLNVSDYSPG